MLASPGNEDRSRPWGGFRWRGREGRKLGAGKALHRHPAAGPPLPVATRVPRGEAGSHLGLRAAQSRGTGQGPRGGGPSVCLCPELPFS